MDDDDVFSLNRAPDEVEVCRNRALVDRSLPLPELPAVAGRAVEAVVDPLRDREELGIAGDPHPVRLESDPTHVAEQRREQLGHPASGRGRVEVHDAPASEPRAQFGGPLHERIDALPPDERLEAARIDRAGIDFRGRGHRRQSLAPRRVNAR
jgi:hypothetical protein